MNNNNLHKNLGKSRTLFRKEGKLYAVAEILSFIESARIKGIQRVDIEGDSIKVNSLRYRVFHNSMKCVHCGIEGKYFYKEKASNNDKMYHLNLYGVTENCYEVLMTKDHIHPKSKCDKNADNMDNLQTMCLLCNNLKDNIVGPLTPKLLLDAAGKIEDETMKENLKEGAIILKQVQKARDAYNDLDTYMTKRVNEGDKEAVVILNRLREIFGKTYYQYENLTN